MGFEDQTCWLVRAGRRARLAPEFVSRSLVSIAWDFDDVGDLSAEEDADVFLSLQAAGRTKPADDLRDLRMFENRLSVGDVVVVPDTAADDLLFGEITGPYAYLDDGDEHRHTRAMRWFGRLATDQVDDVLVTAASVKGMIRRLPEQLHWQRLAGEVEDFLGRPATDVPSRTRTTARRSTGTRRPSARTAKKPARTVTPDRLCPGCGLLRGPTLFDEGEEYCRDCA